MKNAKESIATAKPATFSHQVVSCRFGGIKHVD